jgi:hypothetical protein
MATLETLLFGLAILAVALGEPRNYLGTRWPPRDIGAYWWMYCVGRAKIQLRADAEAIAWFRHSVEANRNFALAHFSLAAALALVGVIDEARATVREGLALNRGFTIRRFCGGASSDNPVYLAERERICEGLRLAGVPEG